MDQKLLNKLPIKIIYSFESLIEELESSEYNFGKFKVFLDYLREAKPELLDGVNSFEEFECLVKDVEPIIDKVIPKPLMKYNLKAITFPFSDKFIFATDRLREILEHKHTHLKLGFSNMDEDTIYKVCCCIILGKYYKENIDYNQINLFEIENKAGYLTYLGTDFNLDYFRIFPSDKKYELTPSQIEDLLNNYEDTQLWRKYIPINSWTAKGFNIISFYDNTKEIALSKLKTKLIVYGEPFDLVKNDIVSSLKSIFKIGDLDIGYTAYNSDKNQLEFSHLNHMSSSMILDKKDNLKLMEITCTDLKSKISAADYYVISNVETMLAKFPQDKMLKIVAKNGIKSLILYPLKNGNTCLGVLEVASKIAGVFNRINANQLHEITPLLEESIYRYTIEFENHINAYIQTEYTSLHSSVEWKFREKAKEHLLNLNQGKTKSQISFQNVYPMYGEIDVRNSSTIRNTCMRIDYQNQIKYLINICDELYTRSNEEKFVQYNETLKDFLDRIDNVDKIYFESELFDFITLHIHAEIPKYVKEKEQSIIVDYLKKLDYTTGLFYIERKKFDQSIQLLNSLLANRLDLFQQDAQSIYPHYYERFKTDGIDFNLYIGRSITPQKKFSYQAIKEIRFWQLQAMIALEQEYKVARKKMPLKIDVASLIFSTNSSLDILFKLDEKRFDVNGYNNAKYEIIKKRISKGFVKGTNERISQPGKLCVVYSEETLREEYTEFFHLLAEKGYLKNDLEYLEVDDLQGVNGLLAMRVSFCYKNDILHHMKLEN